MVPYPACTGWLHRLIPGWTNTELKNSLDLVRNEVTRNWDIHPEMISHTRVINIKTGLPYPETTPDFVPAVKIAAAVITDYGGITSHAAIVSREFGVPCVIGTKIATKVLKDGDRVEVDAEKGIVKKIKKDSI